MAIHNVREGGTDVTMQQDIQVDQITINNAGARFSR